MGILKGKLSERNLAKSISELKQGEEGWVEPAALEIDYELNAYLDLNERVYSEIIRTEDFSTNLYVKRIGESKNDYLIDINKVDDYSWSKTTSPFYCIDEEMLKKSNIIKIGKFKKTKNLEDRIKEALDNEDYERAKRLTERRNSKKRK